jgi:hypothetical protein
MSVGNEQKAFTRTGKIKISKVLKKNQKKKI